MSDDIRLKSHVQGAHNSGSWIWMYERSSRAVKKNCRHLCSRTRNRPFSLSVRSQKEFDVTLLEGGKSVGGLVAGWLTPGGRPVEAGVHGFWYPYRNIFRLIEKDLQIDPFTPWTQSAQYSPNGLEVLIERSIG